MSEEPLPVHINRAELHSLEVPASHEAAGSFDVGLVNHGESLHVHLHLDDDLSEVASLDASNHFIDGHAERAVRVHVDGEGAVHGKLKIVSAYGAQTRYVDVTVTEPEEASGSVEVDESLAEPQPDPQPAESASVVPPVENPELAVMGLGALALVVAAVAALVVESSIVVLGALVVLAGVLGALYVLVVE